MGKQQDDILAALRAVQLAVERIGAEAQQRLASQSNDLALMRGGLHEILRVADLIEQKQALVEQELVRLREAITAAGAANAARVGESFEAVVGEVVETRARVADVELTILDAYLRTHGPPRAPVEATPRE